MPSPVNQIPLMVEKYIAKQERFYNRPVKPFTRFLLTGLGEYLKKQLVNEGVEKEEDQLIPYDFPSDGRKISVAVITEEIGHLTGGRYYVWFMAICLVELGFDVTIYTNQKPAYFDYFRMYKLPKLEIVKNKNDLSRLDIRADIYLSSPLLGNMAVCKLAQKYHKPSFVMVFDPSPKMKEYLGVGFAGWEKLVELIRNSNVKVLSLCDAMSESMYEWLNKRQDQVLPIYPCINSRELNEVQPGERSDYVVFISRIVKHKKFEDVLEAVKSTNVRLKVISSNDGMRAEDLVKKAGLQGRVDFHFNVSDKEKFEIIYGAKAVVGASVFEGFGMWAAEAVATGTPLVCYDFPTMREIQKFSGADNFYFAKWNDPQDLTRKLKVAIRQKKFRPRNAAFDFEAMVGRVSEVFSKNPRIGVITIALNEQKFIGASLRSVIKHPNVKKVAVIEGAVNLFAHAATEDGLSRDKTQEEILKVTGDENGKKIIYERYGWAADKSELRNRALKLLGDDVDYVLVVDGDEVWKPEDLDKLVHSMRENPNTGVFLFGFNHFWKEKNQVAVGGQWNSQMFRCFKFEDKKLHWENHGAPVVNEAGKFINDTNGKKIVTDIAVYHYGYMKDEEDVVAKLEFYKKRDTHLKVVNTWSDWKKGQPTQPTHGGGTVQEFTGTHPIELEGII